VSRDAVSGIFVSGTDTGVGKTVVSCALVRGLLAAGIDIGVMKPVETGVPASGPEDARALREAADTSDDLSLVCPLQYSMSAAPQAAARAEARPISLDRIDAAFAQLRQRHDAMLVEGAGGLLVPFDARTTMADLAGRLELPILLVARAALGTINYTLLSLEACKNHDPDDVGVAISHATGELSGADAANLEILREELGSRLIGEIEPTPNVREVDPESAGLEIVLDRIDRTRSVGSVR